LSVRDASHASNIANSRTEAACDRRFTVSSSLNLAPPSIVKRLRVLSVEEVAEGIARAA